MWLIPSSLQQVFAPESVGSISGSLSDSNTLASSPGLRLCVSGKVTLRPFSSSVWKKKPWSDALFGAAIWPTSTADLGLERWICSLRAFPVNPTVAPENNSGLPTSEATETETDHCRTSCALSASVAPPWCSSKMSQLGLPGDGFNHSERNYREWVTRSKTRSLSLRAMLARTICASESSSWPTVRCHEVGGYQNQADGTTQPTLCRAASNWPSPRAEDSESCGNHPNATDSLTGATKFWSTPNTARRGTESPENKQARKAESGGGCSDLLTQAEYWATPAAHERTQAPRDVDHGIQLANQADNWATPDATAAQRGNGGYSDKQLNRKEGCPSILNYDVLNWATPNARDHKGTDLPSRNGGTSLAHQTQTGEFSHLDRQPIGEESQNTSGRRLSPAFVCWLMGVPWWWTRVEPISFAAQEMAAWYSRARSLLFTLCG